MGKFDQSVKKIRMKPNDSLKSSNDLFLSEIKNI